METVTITLTKDELERLKNAINFQDVNMYHKKMDEKQIECNYVAYDFYHDEWMKNLELFDKLHKAGKDVA